MHCYTGRQRRKQRVMMDFVTSLTRCLWIALLVAEAALVCRLVMERLVSRYPFFAAYAFLDMIAGIILFRVWHPGGGYVRLYNAYIVIISILRIGATGEIYERICEHFPGIGRFRLRLAGILLLIVGSIAYFSIAAVGNHLPLRSQRHASVVEQYQSVLLAGMLVGIWIFFRMLRIAPRYRKNVIVHWRLITLYFLVSAGNALVALLSNFGPPLHLANAAMLAADLALVIAWTVLLNRRGEELPVDDLCEVEISGNERANTAIVDIITRLPRQRFDSN